MSKVDWSTAAAVAKRFSGDYPLAGTYHERRFAEQAEGYVMRASALVAEETGLALPGAPHVGVISRDEWIETNVDSFSALLAPLEKKLASASSSRSLGGRITGIELGGVLGFMSRRVLGQYELVLPTGDDEFGDSVFFVGANVLSIERRNEFRPSHFRFWVALHESAHRAQFTGVPWMRGYFMSLVEQLVESSKLDATKVRRLASEAASSSSIDDLIGEAGLIGLFASDDQLEVIDRVQALMSLLEGHGHVVMDRIGEREIVDVDRMSQVLKARRQDPRTAAFMRLVGLEMKMRQYELGANFIQRIEERAGWSALDHAWESPEALPSLDEIRDPDRWLARMGG